MRESKKSGERGERVYKGKTRPARIEPLRPQAEHIRKFPNNLAKFPEESPYPVLRIHRDGTVLYANKAGEPILKTKGSGVGLPSPAEWRRLAEEVLSSGKMARGEVEHEGRIFEFCAVPIAETNYVNFYGDDVSERKKAEEGVKAERQRLYNVLETLPVMVCLLTPDYHVTFANRRFREKFGEDNGRLCFDYIFGRKRPCEFCEAYNVLKTGKPHHWECTSPDGCSIIDVYDYPFADTDGSPLILEMDIDITEQKQSEKLLRESEERFRRLYERAPLGYQSLDAGGCFIDVNQAWLDLLGYSRDQVIGHWFGDFLSRQEVDAFKQRFPRFKATGEVHVDLEMVQRAGSTIIVHIDGRVGYDEHGQFKQTHCILHDITERKRAEEKLLEYQRQLKQMTSQLALTEERQRRRIAGKLHDQLCQSLALVKIKLDALLASPNSESAKEDLRQVSDAMQQLIEQTRSLVFDLSSPILYEVGFEAAVAEWLNEQVRDKHGIAVEFQDDGLPKPLDNDVRVLLFRNVRELLINVIKHACASKVKVNIRRVGDFVEVAVEDNGVGFNVAEAMAYKAGKFGLFSVRESLEQLGGRFEIESKPDAGCKATMIVPLKRKGIDNERNRAGHQENGN